MRYRVKIEKNTFEKSLFRNLFSGKVVNVLTVKVNEPNSNAYI